MRGDAPSAGTIGPSTTRLQLRFGFLFLFLILVFALLTSTPLARRMLHEPLSRLIAALSRLILSIFGTASTSGNNLGFNRFAASVEEACDGVLPTYIYVSAVLAFPSRWRDKAWGILFGIPAILLINIFRVVTLMMFGAYWRESFEQVHIYVWQAFVIALSLAIWVFWVERFVRPGVRTRA